MYFMTSKHLAIAYITNFSKYTLYNPLLEKFFETFKSFLKEMQSFIHSVQQVRKADIVWKFYLCVKRARFPFYERVHFIVTMN